MMKILKIEHIDKKIKMIEKNIENNELESLQQEVDGLIEFVYYSEEYNKQKIDIIVNEEGKFLDLKPSIAIVQDNKLIDILYGNIVFVGRDNKASSISLNNHQIKFIEESLKNSVCVSYLNKKVVLPALFV